MRRRRTDDGLWDVAARVCAAVRLDMPLSPQDRALLSHTAQSILPSASAERPATQQCGALVEAAPPGWDDKVDVWANRLAQWPVHSQEPALMGSGPPLKRLRLDVAPPSATLYLGQRSRVPGSAVSGVARGRGASTQQASIVGSALARAPTALASTVRGAAPSGMGAYLRAKSLLERTPGDAPIAIALCLMEAFVRFLFEYQPGSAETSVIDPDTPYGARLVDLVSADSRLGGPRDRARAWYQWIATTPGITVARNPQISNLMAGCAGSPGDRHRAPLFLASGRTITGPDDIAVGDSVAPPSDFDVVQPLVLLRFDEEARRYVRDVLNREALSPRAKARALMAQFLLPRVHYGSPARFIDEGVRRHLRGPCVAAASVLPDFTSVFDTRFYIAFWPTGIALMASIGSPTVERLLF
ncbi:hypothetical protein pkur_cds_461 [Pandoravirus kuranda]|uniref:Uncharacterized protein n=1 Tax=Pandoravirus kuranda TaxID=3019033 RepID=A0AA95EES1_9VIRU|nr:hypothetical protein pkur_cds_461 [Pandoravirus kuranda]